MGVVSGYRQSFLLLRSPRFVLSLIRQLLRHVAKCCPPKFLLSQFNYSNKCCDLVFPLALSISLTIFGFFSDLNMHKWEYENAERGEGEKILLVLLIRKSEYASGEIYAL
ncbi:hypothetical protein POVWA2_013390 [Plasmodium ovale wallikeri]|uniref:Uncharacterized protein n=1 Tax=Plasmodium ovale wallikeri TaxID=864142 RepID=A0A1A8YM58_PLAOA|nr:hypothetical protein POVWA1_013170 [Plasmodium ovale wallikeri]SBT33173.1 hypothetical protein POVWA2_013390 [Plasmodium ovale wallikeri]